MKKWLLMSCAFIAGSGCAFKGDVHRMGVDYNSTIANTANDLTLLNVIRAKDYVPLHFTSLGAIRGKIGLNAGTSVGSTVQGDATTTTNSAADGLSTVVAEGVESLTPGLSASLNTGPDFDIAVHDTQEFYQGISTAVPAETIAHFLYQGARSDFISFLLVQRVNFTAHEDFSTTDAEGKPVEYKKGEVIHSIDTSPHAPSAAEFAKLIRCFELSPVAEKGAPVSLATAARLDKVELKDLALLDGKKLDLAGGAMTRQGDADSKVMIQRVGESSDSLKLFLYDEADPDACALSTRFKIELTGEQVTDGGNPDDHKDVLRVTRGRLLQAALPSIATDTEKTAALGSLMSKPHRRPESGPGSKGPTIYPAGSAYPVDVSFVFRSVEGIFQFVGDYIRTDDDPKLTLPYWIEGRGEKVRRRLFDVWETKPANAFVLASARHLGRTYYVLKTDRDDENYRYTMSVLGLLQQLTNLQKKSSDKPSTQSVRVLN